MLPPKLGRHLAPRIGSDSALAKMMASAAPIQDSRFLEFYRVPLSNSRCKTDLSAKNRKNRNPRNNRKNHTAQTKSRTDQELDTKDVGE